MIGWIQKYLIAILATALALVFVGGLFTTWRWHSVSGQLAAQVESCNADKLASAQEASEIARKAQADADSTRIAELARRLEVSEQARDIAEHGRDAEKAGKAELEARIDELEKESFDEDDIPDSGACLNAFMLYDNYRLLYAQSCGETSDSGSGQGEDGSCTGTLSEGKSFSFAPITYGDAIKLWRDDRGSLIACNADKRAIRALNEGLQ